MNNDLRLSDETIGHIAKLIQLAILTGTDIVDNLRTLRLVDDAGSLYLSKDHRDSFDKNIQKMAEEIQSEQETEPSEAYKTPSIFE